MKTAVAESNPDVEILTYKKKKKFFALAPLLWGFLFFFFLQKPLELKVEVEENKNE